MNIIKFRAWIKNEKRMVDVKSIHLETKKIMYGYSENEHCYGNKTISLKNVELMQFTGLKDKNGKEVYEGYIIKCIFEDDNETSAIIKYGKFKDENYKDDFMLGWYIELFDYEENRNIQLSIFNGDSSKTVLDIYEVVGNVYEKE